MRKSSKFDIRTGSKPEFAWASVSHFTPSLTLLPCFMNTYLPCQITYGWSLSFTTSAALFWSARYLLCFITEEATPHPPKILCRKHAVHCKVDELTCTSCGFSSSSSPFARMNLEYCHFLTSKMLMLADDRVALTILFPSLRLGICWLLPHCHTTRYFRGGSASNPAIACYGSPTGAG